MLASADQVAIDAVAAKLMGFDPLTIPYIRLAHERGLGCGDVREIELVGDDVSDLDLHFHVGHNFASRVGHGLWFGPLGAIQKLFFHTPLVYGFIFGVVGLSRPRVVAAEGQGDPGCDAPGYHVGSAVRPIPACRGRWEVPAQRRRRRMCPASSPRVRDRLAPRLGDPAR